MLFLTWQVPKRGLPTPRYLLKLRTEVEIMQQLGYSLDAVNLKDVFEDDEAIHLVRRVVCVCGGGEGGEEGGGGAKKRVDRGPARV